MNASIVRRVIVAAVAGIVVVLGLLASGVRAAPAAQAGNTVEIRNFAFVPNSLTVPVGTTVTWTNADQAPHTATARNGSFDTGQIAQGESKSATLNTAGTFEYFCEIHPQMTATLVVEAAQQSPSPSPSPSAAPSASPSVAPSAAPSASPSAAPAAAPTAPQEVSLRVANNATLGNILTDSAGRTLYRFTRDEANVSNCYDQCATRWPPLIIAQGSMPTGGAGVTGQLGVIDRRDGTRQVTYNNMPLYYFANDANPGDTNGQNVGNVWFVVTVDGAAAASPATAPSASPSAAPVASPESAPVTSPAPAGGAPNTLPNTGTSDYNALLVVLGALLLLSGFGISQASRWRKAR